MREEVLGGGGGISLKAKFHARDSTIVTWEAEEWKKENKEKKEGKWEGREDLGKKRPAPLDQKHRRAQRGI